MIQNLEPTIWKGSYSSTNLNSKGAHEEAPSQQVLKSVCHQSPEKFFVNKEPSYKPRGNK